MSYAVWKQPSHILEEIGMLLLTPHRDPHRVPVEFIPTCFTESLRIPVTVENRQFLSTLRAAELELWFQVRRQAGRGELRCQTNGRAFGP